jgi:peptidoglycan/LPS O-acetylase OafA/YrhL
MSFASLIQYNANFERKSSVYRPDIDGMRAIAVLLVLGFHAFPDLLIGGFIGVDIFFVISGYLITGLVLFELCNKEFSLSNFYMRRCKRILPALVVVLLGCAIFGYLLLLASEYVELGSHINASAAFYSNFILWRDAGYFDTEAERKPLLHLWSLAVEEQFYLIWPLTLWLAHKARFKILHLTISIVVASFITNVVLTSYDATTAFYLPMPRFWELLSGAALASLQVFPETGLGSPWLQRIGISFPRRRYWHVQDVASALGMISICLAVLLLDRHAAFPGWWAILPVLGATLLIAASPKAWLNRAVLGHPVLVSIGLISYPLYLWHWPLLAFARIVTPESLSAGGRALLLIAAAALAVLTYKLMEQPVRRRKIVSAAEKRLFLGASIAMLAALYLVGYEIKNRRIQSASQQLNDVAYQYQHWRQKKEIDFWGSKSCFLLDRDWTYFEKNNCWSHSFANRPSVLLIGDSHAAYLSLGLRPFLESRQVNLSQYNAAYCSPLASEHSDERCSNINQFVFSEIAAKKPDVVIMFAYYTNWSKAYSDVENYQSIIAKYIRRIGNLGARHVIIIGQMPTWEGGLPALVERNFVLRHREVPFKTHVGLVPGSLEMDKLLRSQNFGDRATYISLSDSLCDFEGCRTRVGDHIGTDLLVFDYGHLTKAGAAYVTQKVLAPVLQSAIENFEP